MRDNDGLSLLELTLILAAAVLITAALAPAILRVIHSARQDAARDEMSALYRAMVGSEADGTYGFIGDMGRLPFDASELVQGAGQPLYTPSPTSGVAYGWNGPYVNRGADGDDYRLDPWGNPYDIGVIGQGQIRSAGPDGLIDDGDDIVFPPNPLNVYGTLIVTVKGHQGDEVVSDPESCVVTLHFGSSGVDTTVVDEVPPFSFTDVHRGLHTVEVTCPRNDGGTATETSVAAVQGTAQQAIELHVELGEMPSTAPGAGGAEATESATGNATQAPAQTSQR